MKKRRTYDHLPEWEKLRKSYALAQIDFNPPEEQGIGVHRVLNITEGFGFRGGLQFLSISKFTKLVQAFREKYHYLMRQKQMGKVVPPDEENRYGKNSRQRSEGERNRDRRFAYSPVAKKGKKLDRRAGREKAPKQVDSKVRDDAQRLF
tara:strand:+ start:147 stop:593 length:447 start_codon:yes stop_codon:yes gene_type:complete